MNLLFRWFLAFNASSPLLVVYLIKAGVTITIVPPCILHVPDFFSYAVYILAAIISTAISIFLSAHLDKTDMEIGAIESVEYANDAFLPSYLGYFFVALDVPNTETLCYVYPIILGFTFLSQTLYFNPLFLIFGYHFYNLTTVNNVRIFMITKKKINKPKTISFPSLTRISDFTFIDQEP